MSARLDWRKKRSDGERRRETSLDATASAHASALWAGLNLLLLLVLSLLVVRQRQKQHVLFGDGGVPALAQAIRAFGNAAEYAPAGIVGLAVMALAGAPAAAIHVGGGLLFAGRVAHAIGLSRTSGPSPLRSAGMILTWLAYILVGVALLIYAVG